MTGQMSADLFPWSCTVLESKKYFWHHSQLSSFHYSHFGRYITGRKKCRSRHFLNVYTKIFMVWPDSGFFNIICPVQWIKLMANTASITHNRWDRGSVWASYPAVLGSIPLTPGNKIDSKKYILHWEPADLNLFRASALWIDDIF